MFSSTNIVDVRMDIIIAIYLYSNFRGYFGSPVLMIVFHYSTIYLLTFGNGLYLHVDGIFVALAPGWWWGVGWGGGGWGVGGGGVGGWGGGGGGGWGGGGRGFRFLDLGLQGLYSATNCVVTIMRKTTKQTKAINDSYIYIYIYISCKCDTNRAGHFTLDAHASRPVACALQWGHMVGFMASSTTGNWTAISTAVSTKKYFSQPLSHPLSPNPTHNPNKNSPIPCMWC